MPVASTGAADQDGYPIELGHMSRGRIVPILPLYCLPSESNTGGSHVPGFGAVDDDLEGPLAGQLRDLRKQRTRQVGSANDEGFTSVHRLGSAEDSRVTQTVGDSGRINGRLDNIVFTAATAATVNLGVGKLFDRHGVAFL